ARPCLSTVPQAKAAAARLVWLPEAAPQASFEAAARASDRAAAPLRQAAALARQRLPIVLQPKMAPLASVAAAWGRSRAEALAQHSWAAAPIHPGCRRPSAHRAPGIAW